jgi:gamma-tubulin complex component 2
MTTMSAFVSYQASFNMALIKFLADPATEGDAAKANQRWTVLSKFEINFNHHTKVGHALDRDAFKCGDTDGDSFIWTL